MAAESDWRDGFLFVGNHLSLDFLNTQPVIDGNPVELLPDAGALVRWLVAAELLDARGAGELEKTWPTHAKLELIREFREELRRVVLAIEGGRAVPATFVTEMNRLLAQHPFTDEIVREGSELTRQRRFDFQKPNDVLTPLVDAVTDLIVSADHSKIRKCDSCVLHFYDTSKKGTRRWCSMQMCGNRAKVSAYAERQRGEREI